MGKYRDLGPGIDRTFRNDLNANFDDVDTDIQGAQATANGAVATANNAVTTANSAVTTANNAVTIANSVQEQFNQVVIEGDSSVESAQARVDSSGQTYATLKERLDTKEDSFTTQLADKVFQTDLSESGRKIKIVAFILRNDGTGWNFINDTIHQPLNATSVTADNVKISVTLPFTAKKILSFVACTDDTFAQFGYFTGASVGTNVINIYMSSQYQTIGGYIKYDGTQWVVYSEKGNIAVSSFSSGVLSLTHDDVGATSYLASASPRDGGYIPALGSLAGTTSQINFYDYAGNLITTPDINMKVFFTRSMWKPKQIYVDPTTISNQYGNIWCLGAFEI